MGDLPTPGVWTRLEIPAETIGLAGKTVSGMVFGMWDGQVWFDRIGKEPASSGSALEPSVMTADGGEEATPERTATVALQPQTDATIELRKYSLYSPELQLMAETNAATSSPWVAYEYVWFGGEPLAQVEIATNEVSYYFNDHLGAPILQTDATGAVVWRVERDPYGERYSTRVGVDRHQPLGLPGQEYDASSDRQYNIFRWYRPGWGRYTQADPIGLEGGANVYQYGAANPNVFVDPLGLKVCRCIRRLAAFPLTPPKATTWWPPVRFLAHHAFIQITDDSLPCDGYSGDRWGYQGDGLFGATGRVEREKTPKFNPMVRCSEVACIDESELRSNISSDSKRTGRYDMVCAHGPGITGHNCQGWVDNVLDRSRKENCCGE